MKEIGIESDNTAPSSSLPMSTPLPDVSSESRSSAGDEPDATRICNKQSILNTFSTHYAIKLPFLSVITQWLYPPRDIPLKSHLQLNVELTQFYMYINPTVDRHLQAAITERDDVFIYFDRMEYTLQVPSFRFHYCRLCNQNHSAPNFNGNINSRLM